MNAEPDFAPPSAMRSLFIGPDGRIRPIFRALLFAALAYLLLSPVQALVGALGRGWPPRLLFPLAYVALNSVLLFLTWVFLRALDYRSFRVLGLSNYPGWGRELALGIAIGAAMMAVVVGGIVAVRGIRYVGFAALSAAFGRQTLRLAALLFLAAAYEEILYRGYAFQRLVDAVGARGAILIISALFGVAHLRNPSVTPLSTANTVLAGILLSVAYLKTRALWLPIGLHWAWNFFMGPVLSLHISGLQFGQPLFLTEDLGPAWLSGGAYGPEGSVVVTAVVAGSIVWLARTLRIAPSPKMKEALE